MSDIEYKLKAQKPKDIESLPSLCRMEISVGQPYHEGTRFSLAMEWAKNNHDQTIIFLADTQQRYNIAYFENKSEEDALDISYQRGQEWVTRNKDVIVDTPTVSWNYFLNHPEFLNAKQAVHQLLQDNTKFKENLEHSAYDFCRRSNIPDSDKAQFIHMSKEYLIEEVAGLSINYQEYPGISAYPGSFSGLWAQFLDESPPKELEGLSNAHCVRLRFNRRKPTQSTGNKPASPSLS